MPSEKITSTTVIDDHAYNRSLHLAWGPKGGAPHAPDGWVNAGFAEIQIRDDHGTTGNLTGITLDQQAISQLIRVLKRIRRSTR